MSAERREPAAQQPRSGLARQSLLTGVAAAAALGSGLVLDLIVAWRFGANAETDAYFAGIRIPLAIGTVLLVAASQALVPTFSWWFAQRQDDEAKRDSSTTVLLAFGALLLAALALIVLAPLLLLILGAGFSSAQRDLAIDVLRIGALTLPFAAGAEALRAFLNAQYRFVAPALVNVTYSGTAAVIVLFATDAHITVIAWSLVAGSVVRLLVLMVMAWRHGFRLRVPTAWREDEREVRVALVRSIRPIATGAAAPLSRMGDVFIASFLPAGSLSLLSYASRVVSALGGTILFRSVMTALVPRLAGRLAADDQDGAQQVNRAGMVLMVALCVPVTAVVVGLAQPIANILFARGNFSSSDTWLLGLTLATLGLSLPFDAASRALLAPFIASLDTRTPLRNAYLAFAANLVFLPCLTLPFRSSSLAIVGAAAAFTLGQVASATHALIAHVRTYGRPDLGQSRFAVWLLVGAGVGATLIWTLAFSNAHADGSGQLDLVPFAFGLVFLTMGAVVAWRRGVASALRVVEPRTSTGAEEA